MVANSTLLISYIGHVYVTPRMIMANDCRPRLTSGNHSGILNEQLRMEKSLIGTGKVRDIIYQDRLLLGRFHMY